MNSYIHISLASDDKYAPFMGVTILSIVNTIDKKNLYFHILDNDISNENKEKIKTILNNSNHKIQFYSMTLLDNYDLPSHDCFPVIVYGRIFLGELLDQSIERVIYMDSDIIVRKDISTLYNRPMLKTMAAVEEPLKAYQHRLNYLNIPQNKSYFNSGVLLIDLKQYRKKFYQKKCIDYIKNNKQIEYFDQDTLNAVIFDDVEFIEHNYNATLDIWNKNYSKEDFYRLQGKQIKSLKEITIIHYNERPKPWYYKSSNPLRNEYRKYIRISPWKDYHYPDKSLHAFIKDKFKMLFIKRILTNHRLKRANQ